MDGALTPEKKAAEATVLKKQQFDALPQEEKIQEAALRIQRLFRGHLARKRVDLLELEHYEAIVNGVEAKNGKSAIKARPLTAGERAVVEKRAADDSEDRSGKKYADEQRAAYLEILKTSEKLHDAATTIQAAFRGYRERDVFLDRKHLKKLEDRMGLPSFLRFNEEESTLIKERIVERGKKKELLRNTLILKRYQSLMSKLHDVPVLKDEQDAFDLLRTKSAILIQKHWRGRQARNILRDQKDLARLKKLETKSQEEGFVAFEGDDAALIMERLDSRKNLFETAPTRKDPSKNYEANLAIIKRYEALVEKIKEPLTAEEIEAARNKDEAARKIQKLWRGQKEKAAAAAKKKGPPTPPAAKTPAEIEKEIRDYIANQEGVTIDSRQLKKEMGDPAKMGSPAKDYTPFGNHQNQWIDGIYGHTNYPKDIKGNPIPPMDKDGNPIPWDDHLGMKRARDLLYQTIELSPAGVPVAVYSSLLELQRDIDKVKRKHEGYNFPGGVNPIGFNEVRTSIVRYNDPQATRPCYIMLTETREGITQHFVNDTALYGEVDAIQAGAPKVKGKITAATENDYKTDAYVQKVTDLYNNSSLAHITDHATRMETAHLMARQEIRDKMMKSIIEEVHQDQKMHKALRPLDEEDLKRLSGDKDFRDKVGTAFMSHKVPPATFKNGAVSISKTHRAADIIFDPEAEHQDYKINIPDTNFYIGVHIAKESREHQCWVNGSLVPVYREKGEVWIDDNTVHYQNGSANGPYEPLCIHTVNTSARKLADHTAAKTQFGGFGVSRARSVIDNFAIKVRSPDGVAVKVGKKVRGSILDPIAHVDKGGEKVKITKELPTVAEIEAAVNPDDRWKGTDEQYVQCSVNLRKDEPDNLNKKDREENEAVADPVAKALETAFGGPIFVKIKRVPNKKDAKGERHIEGEYYQDKRPFRYDENKDNGAGNAKGGYVEITKAELKNKLRDLKREVKDTDDKVTVGPDPLIIDDKDIDKYAERFFERVTKKVRVRNLLSENQFEENEEKLRYNARNGHLKSYKDAAGVSVEGVEDIITKYTALDAAIKKKFEAGENTSEEIAEFRSKMVFDINAKDPETSRTALHLAAMSGQQVVVEALMAAGADPTIKDQNGKTAAELAREEGKFNPKDTNSWVVKLESDAEKFKLAQSRKEVEDLKRDSAILQGRAADLKEKLDKLVEDVKKFTTAAQVAFATTPETDETKAASKAAQADLTKGLKDLDDARAESIKAENLAIAALEKSKGKAPKGPKIKAAKVVPDDNTYEVENSFVDLGGGKSMKIPCYYATKDGVVPVYVNGKQENIMMKAGEVMFAKNTVLLINADGSEFAQPVQKFGLRASNPDGWSDAEWKDKACVVHETFVKEVKKDPQLFHNAAQEVEDSKGNKVVIKFTDPVDFKRIPSSATVKHPTATVISEIEKRKQFVADLKKERAKAKEVAQKVGGGAAHT